MTSVAMKRIAEGKAWGAVRIPHTIHPILMAERVVANRHALHGVYLTEDEARALRDDLNLALGENERTP